RLARSIVPIGAVDVSRASDGRGSYAPRAVLGTAALIGTGVDVRVTGDVDLALHRQGGWWGRPTEDEPRDRRLDLLVRLGAGAGVRRGPAHRDDIPLVRVDAVGDGHEHHPDLGAVDRDRDRGAAIVGRGYGPGQRGGQTVRVGRIVESPDGLLQTGFGDGTRLRHQLLVGGDQGLGGRQQGKRDDQGREDQQRQHGHRQGDASLVSQQVDVQLKAAHMWLLVATGYFSAAPGIPWWRTDWPASRPRRSPRSP